METRIKKFDEISGIYALFGALLGFLVYLVTKFDIKEVNKMYLILVLLVFFVSNLLLIKTTKGEDEKIEILHFIPSITFSLGLSLAYYLIVKVNIDNYINQNSNYHNGAYVSYLNLSLLIFYIISILYFKSFLSSENKKIKEIFSYHNLKNIFIKYTFTISSSFIFLGATWLILLLWSVLFNLINIDFFHNLLFDTSILPLLISGSVIFASFYLSNKKIWKFHKVLSALSSFQIFLELISAFLILFMIFLPIMGVQKIFSTGYSSVIMLVLNTIGLVLIQFINLKILDISKFRKYLITSYIALQPVFSILAFYSIMIRINQYGFTPERYMIFITVLIFNIFNLIYLFMVIKHKLNWREFLDKITPYLIPISVFIITLTLTPILNPYEISVKSQLFKYEDNIEKMDLIELKFKLSKPGKLAFKKLKEKYATNKKAIKKINKVDACINYWSCKSKLNNDSNRPNNKVYKYTPPEMQYKIYPKEEEINKAKLKKTLALFYPEYTYSKFQAVVIKDLLENYEDKEILVFYTVWINSQNYLYQGLIVKENTKYKLYQENIIRNKKIEDIDFSNIKIVKEDEYKIKFLDY